MAFILGVIATLAVVGYLGYKYHSAKAALAAVEAYLLAELDKVENNAEVKAALQKVLGIL